MNTERGHDIAPSPERQEDVSVTYLGRLVDFGLGSPEGIPSRLKDATQEELTEYGEMLLASSKQVTDFEHDSCIDGRHRKGNCDGSETEVRERHVSGSGSNTEIALNAGSPILEAIPVGATLKNTVAVVDDIVGDGSGKKPSAHTGICGGVAGAVVHNRLIGSEPAVLSSTEAIMNLPQVAAVTGVSYDAALGEEVREQAPKTADWLEENGWDGQTYVDRTVFEEPAGVENLETAHDKFHGHAEDAVVIDLRDGVVVTADDVFVISMSAITKKARALGGEPGEASYTRALIADIAKHMAVAKVLPSEGTPLFIIG